MEFNFITILDLTGTFAFALSGIRLASQKQIDLFGAYIIGLVTATGGGTLRDLLLDVPPFWMLDVTYFLVTAIALLAAVIFRERLFKWGNTLFLFDTIGLGLFTVVGLTKSVDAGLPFWICIGLGAITGFAGGVVRDVVLNEVPLIFRKDIYALTCVAGGGIYYISIWLGVAVPIGEIIAALSVIIFRLLIVRYHIHLPTLQPISLDTD